MAPFLVDPISTFIIPTKRKLAHISSGVPTTTGSGGKISTPVIIAIIASAAVLILVIVVAAYIQKRKKSKGKGISGGGGLGLTRGNTFSGYSADASGGLYGGTPGSYAGGSGEQQQHEGARHHEASGYGSDQDSGSEYSTGGGGPAVGHGEDRKSVV